MMSHDSQKVSDNIGVITVTFNRISKLKRTLECYENQTVKPKYILIIDNHSDDGTESFLREWQNEPAAYKKHVVTMETNTGGSGGFHEAIRKASNMNADWIWIADDDAYPDHSAIELAGIATRSANSERLVAFCGAVYENGELAIGHRRRITVTNSRIFDKAVPATEYGAQSFSMEIFSFVGVILNKQVLLQAGLPKKEYFIYNDDMEYSMRFAEKGEILCFPGIKIHHDVPAVISHGNDTWKEYYRLRNQLDAYRCHYKAYTRIHRKLLLRCWFRLMIHSEVGKYRMKLDAINDAHKGNLGFNSNYCP